MSELLMAFYGDDFTGSTDAMESLARCGIRTVLFTTPPSGADLEACPGLRAFGVAGRSRSLSCGAMRETLLPAFGAIRETGVPIVHYKVCSTFDSSPTVGSIGCAIDVGTEVFGTTCVPIVAGAPALGRHCVFGNLFARGSGEPSPVRLDRHPNMQAHPITPMNESDLRLHLNWQTEASIALFDITQLNQPNAPAIYRQFTTGVDRAVLIDFLFEEQSKAIGSLLLEHAERQRPLFVVGSSGVEAALSACWNDYRPLTSDFTSVRDNGPILVAVGSCSPVAARQIACAESSGFGVSLLTGDETDDLETIRDVSTHLEHGRSVVIHTGGTDASVQRTDRDHIGTALAEATRNVVQRTGVRRLLVAGGDTSGHVADKLQLRSLEMIAPLVRGAPLCRATSSIPEIDGLEVVFKGGQIGGDDFFSLVQHGTPTGIHP